MVNSGLQIKLPEVAYSTSRYRLKIQKISGELWIPKSYLFNVIILGI